ncbi:MAG: type II methionyl aminopeptidase, partial [Ignisphaera sp.]
RGLQFTKLCLIIKFRVLQLNLILVELHKNKLLILYPVLIEKANGVVAQFEHTVLIDNRGNTLVITEQC